MLNALPILIALTAPQGNANAQQPAPRVPQKTEQPTQTTGTITCPLTGETIRSCCCPVKK